MPATLITATSVPAGSQNGDVVGSALNHVTVSPASGAGTYSFNHNLPYVPAVCIVVSQGTEGTTPTVNSLATFCPADTTSTVLAFNVAASGTFDVYFV